MTFFVGHHGGKEKNVLELFCFEIVCFETFSFLHPNSLNYAAA